MYRICEANSSHITIFSPEELAGSSKGFGKVRSLNRNRQRRRAWTTGKALTLGAGKENKQPFLSQFWQSHNDSGAIPTLTLLSCLSMRSLSLEAVLGLWPPLPELCTAQCCRVLLSQVAAGAFSHCSSALFIPCLTASSFSYYISINLFPRCQGNDKYTVIDSSGPSACNLCLLSKPLLLSHNQTAYHFKRHLV